MKVIAQTAALQEALAVAGGIVITRSPKPILACVKMIAADNVLTILATDLEVGTRYQVTAVQIQEEGEALVPAERLNGIVRESGDEESLTIETEKEACLVRGAAGRFRIFGYDPAEYPAVAEFPDDADFQIQASELSGMIAKTLFATAKTHSHYAISGVLWECTGKKLQLVATDGHRLAMAKGSTAKAAARNVTAIVPAKLMGLVQRLAGDGEQMLDVRVEENQILVRTPQAVLVSSLVQGNFPKYSDVVPKDTAQKASIQRAMFEHRLRQAALLTDEESRGVRLSFHGNELTLSSRVPEAGDAELTCPVKYDGEDLDIAFNPAFLIDALRVVGTEEVSFEMNASNKPAMIKAGNDFLYVLMPVDLS